MISKLLYGKKRRDRWWRYLALRDAFLQAQRDDRPEKALISVFRKLGYGAPDTAIMDCWNSTVSVGATRRPVLEPDSVRALKHRVAALNPALLPVQGWLDLYHLGIGMGLYLLANSYREKAMESAILAARNDSPGRGDLVLAVYSDIEKGKYEAARELLEAAPGAGLPVGKAEQAGWLLNLFAGKRDGKQIGFADQASAEDLQFGRFVENKDLALVGPVPSQTEHGPLIDQYDVVVKFSYRGGDKGRDPKTQGQRLDISYYNNTQAGVLARSNFQEVLDAISWGVCINHKGRRQFPEQQEHLRQITSLQWLLPDTHFNAGPNAVIDLLRFNPRNIKVFNTDLMLSAGRYAGYRPAGAKPIEYTRSFIKTHDPILQYKTMHRLWELGYISGDQGFEAVMRMGLENYLLELQKVHGANEQALL